ncbi:hypothetical protein ACO1O0_003667 [Amphichorda felina]
MPAPWKLTFLAASWLATAPASAVEVPGVFWKPGVGMAWVGSSVVPSTTTPTLSDPAGPTTQGTTLVSSDYSGSSSLATATSHDDQDTAGPSTVASSGTVITGTDGAVVTYVPTQDPLETGQTGTITKTDDGTPIVIFPGGWMWTPINVPPTLIELPPAPTDSPDLDQTLPPDASVVTGTDGAVVTYVPTKDPDRTTQTGTTTTTDDSGFPVVIFPGGWIWTPINVPPAVTALPPAPTGNPDLDQTPPLDASIVTGTDGAVVTYAPTQDPDRTTQTGTTTTTDDNGLPVVIFPGGWMWTPIGIPPVGITLPPPPTLNPKPGDGDSEKPTEAQPTATATEECNMTAPPECTMTISYISDGTSYSSTEYGSCPPVTGCASGEQTTTTTTIDPEVTGIWAESPEEEYQDIPAEDVDEDTELYFETLFDEADISIKDELNMIQNMEAVNCTGELPGIPAECFQSVYPAFCEEVNQDQTKALSKIFTANDATASDGNQRRAWAGRPRLLERRRLSARDEACSSWLFQFDWSGAQGECDSKCSDAMGLLGAACLADQTHNEGSIGVGCGTYRFVIGTAMATSSTTIPPSSIPTPSITIKTSTTTQPPATIIPVPSPVACNEAQDCIPAIVCSHGNVNACHDGQCACDVPSTPQPYCYTDNDCGDTACPEGLVAACASGLFCNCVEPQEPPTDPAPKPNPGQPAPVSPKPDPGTQPEQPQPERPKPDPETQPELPPPASPQPDPVPELPNGDVTSVDLPYEEVGGVYLPGAL